MESEPAFVPRLGIGDPLPRVDAAIISAAKLRDYALDPDHPVGAPKARVFAAALDIERDDWEYLRAAIARALPAGRVETINRGTHSTSYGVVLRIHGLNGRIASVLTAWVLESAVPRLVSLRVDRGSLDS